MTNRELFSVTTAIILGPEAFDSIADFEREAGMTLGEYEAQHCNGNPWYRREGERGHGEV